MVLVVCSLVRNSVVLAVYLLFSVVCFFTVHEHYIKAIHTVEGKKMLETIDGIFLSGQPEHVRIIEV